MIEPARLKIIVRNCGPDDFTLAGRAARWGLTEMTGKNGIVTYGPSAGPPAETFYVQRNKSSLTVIRITEADNSR